MTIFASKQPAVLESITESELETRLVGNKPVGAAFIACSELGACIPGMPHDLDLTVHLWQNMGGFLDNPATLETLFRHKKISDVVVLGHYPCPILRKALEGSLSEISDTSRQYFTSHVAELKEEVEKEVGEWDDEAFRIASERHILRQLKKVMELMFNPDTSERKLLLHGWLWIEEGSRLLSFDPETGNFRSIAYKDGRETGKF